MEFKFDGRIYESDKQQVVGVCIRHEDGEALKVLEPMFVILPGDKGWQLKRTLFGGRKQHLKTFKTVEAAIKYSNKIAL